MPNSTPTLKTDSAGTRRCHLNGGLHRTDGPAIEDVDGTKEWWVKGGLHPINAPAIQYPDGTKEWWVSGKRHRADGPAVEYDDGGKEWWVKGELHRADGPAIEEAYCGKEWWLNGKRHRIDGPAIERAHGSKEWYVNGKYIVPPSSHVLTAAFALGLSIPPEIFADMLKAMSEASVSPGSELNQLNSILYKHWATHVNKILATLFMDTDPTIKNIAFSLLGCAARLDNTRYGVRL